MNTRLTLVAAVALFDGEDRVLLARRPEGKSMAGLWEFPGGKIETGETPEAALIRELGEELDIQPDGSALKPLNFCSFAYPDFNLLMVLFECREWSGAPKPLEGQTLAWVDVDDLMEYDAPAADIPLFKHLALRKQRE